MSKIVPKTTKEHIVNIYNKIELLEKNHIWHLQRDVRKLNYVLWTVGFMVSTQFIAWVLRMVG
jgi:hypothetical protein|tara:strand:- start:73 stop:261 length:189 start_codon:yes stop_codon:yes gene_type:complete